MLNKLRLHLIELLPVRKVSLALSTKCQLRCPLCSTGIEKNEKNILGNGFLSFTNFKKFIQLNPNIKEIEISGWGEPFLNPEINKIIEFATQKSITLTCYNGTNFNSISKKTIENLVKSKLKILNIALDGVTQRTYEKYRVKGNIKKVIENIRILNNFKKEYNSVYPKLTWQYILFGYNLNEINKAKKLAEKLNMKFQIKLNHTPSFSPIKNENEIKKKYGLDFVNKNEFKSKTKKIYLNVCNQFWEKPHINFNGDLLGCCSNLTQRYGNVFEEKLKNLISKKQYQDMKRAIMKKQKMPLTSPCNTCSNYIK